MEDVMLIATIENNAAWCAAVCATHGISSTMESGIWIAEGSPPRYYPDAITLNPEITAEQVAAIIAGRNGGSIKDSVATLDLAPHGFELLFTANWIAIDSPPPAAQGSTWDVISSAEGAQRWRDAQGDADSIRDELIDDPNVALVMGCVGDGDLAGAIAYRSDSAVGISNVFNSGSNQVSAWQAVAANVASTFPGLPIVGYEQGEDLMAAIAAGFTEIGPLRVWVRKSSVALFAGQPPNE
ncbi:MAG: hypothetical protein ACR2OU_11625 [Thermomicrobiales bacterium]